MENKDHRGIQTELTFYLSPATISDKEQQRFNDLFVKHPSERNYLSYNEYAEFFAGEKEECAPLFEFAKNHQLKVIFNGVKREAKLKVPNQLLQQQTHQHELYNNGLASAKPNQQLFALNPLGDIGISFDTNLKSLGNSNSSPLPSKLMGFTKLFEEKRPRLLNSKSATNADKTGIKPTDFAKLYNFPDADGTGECIGIIELGGTFDQSDLKQYFDAIGFAVPEIKIVGTPAKSPENENIEVTADIQVVGSLAPKAKLVIYYGTSILDAIKNALTDKNNTPSVLSISWAGSEYYYSNSELNELNSACYEAALRGITIVASSGDYGAFNNMPYPNVNVPANLPFILGCGGTKIQVQGEQLIQNNIWNESTQSASIATGGGFSQRIASPGYTNNSVSRYLYAFPQYGVYNPSNGRPVPDVSANAADSSGYSILFNKQWIKLGGTSLSTPLWAALIARINQKLGYRLGFINNLLYNLEASPAFIQSIYGNNGLYTGAWGWNPCTGLGSPNGVELLNSIKKFKIK